MEYRIQPMTVGELLDTCLRVLMDNLTLFLLIGGSWIFGAIPVGVAVFGSLFFSGFPLSPEIMEHLAGTLSFILAMVVFVCTVVFLQYLCTAALTRAVSERYLGRKASYTASFKIALQKFWPLTATLLLEGIILFVALIPGSVLVFLLGSAMHTGAAGVTGVFSLFAAVIFLIIFPIAYIVLGFYIVPAVVILEGEWGIEGLQRSWRLMKGSRGKAFVILLVAGAAGNLVLIFIGMIPILGGFIQLFGQILFFVFWQTACTIFYFHCRCEKEGFDVEHLAEQLHTSKGYPPLE